MMAMLMAVCYDTSFLRAQRLQEPFQLSQVFIAVSFSRHSSQSRRFLYGLGVLAIGQARLKTWELRLQGSLAAISTFAAVAAESLAAVVPSMAWLMTSLTCGTLLP